jgi:hypothetical protein
MGLIRLISCSLAPRLAPCGKHVSRDAPELRGLCKIPGSL